MARKLLALFALLMIVVAVLMLRGRSTEGEANVVLNRGNAQATGIGWSHWIVIRVFRYRRWLPCGSA